LSQKPFRIIWLLTWIFLFCVQTVLFSQMHGPQITYQSKWNRVMVLGQQVVTGVAASRLRAKDDILAILLEEESGYPVVYVDKYAKGPSNGTSWYNAYKDIQVAIDAVSNSGGEAWIWVANGVYGAITLKSKVMLFGGFSGVETSINERDPDKNICVIQGWKGEGGHGLRAVFMQHRTLIDGFLIRNSGYERSPTTEWGGKVADDIAGGGIKTGDWFSIIRNNRFTNNYAKGGGGIALWNRYGWSTETVSGYSPIVERNYIYRNHAVCGAGIQIRNSAALVCHNVIAYNNHIPVGGEGEKSKGFEIVRNKSLSKNAYIINNIIWGHPWRNVYNFPYAPRNGGSYQAYNCAGDPTDDSWHTGRISADPLFKDPGNNDFTLQENSPCIDAGHPSGPLDPDGSRADIGIYDLRYALVIDDDGAGGQHGGAGWYFPGSKVTISTDSVVVDMEGTTRYKFLEWQGTGEGSYSGDSLVATVNMDTSIVQRILWRKEFYLQVDTNSEVDTLSGWYSDGTEVSLRVPTLLQIGDTERRRFITWDGEGEGSNSETDTTITLSINNPIIQQVNWDTEYFVDIVSDKGNPRGEDWYSSGTMVSVVIDTIVTIGEGDRYRFKGWEGEGQSAYTGELDSFQVELLSPIKQTAVWEHQYFLDIETVRGYYSGEGWHPEDSLVTIKIDTIETVNDSMRYCFYGWEGTGDDSYTGPDKSPSIRMSGPMTEKAIWHMEYWITLSIEPKGYGIVEPFGTSGGWSASGLDNTILGIGDADSGYGFVRWSGDIESTENPLSFDPQEPMTLAAHFKKGDVTIKTHPSGLRFSADGIEYSSPRVFYWLPEEKHTLKILTPQDDGQGTRYFFYFWEDSNSNEHEVEISEGPTTYQAHFQIEYCLSIETDHGAGHDPGWYPAGEKVTVWIDSLVHDTTGVRQVFTHWEGEGEGSTDDTQTRIDITMNGPVTQCAFWRPEYLLYSVTEPYYGGQIQLSPSGPWYQDGQQVAARAVPTDENFNFTGWSDAATGTSNPVTVTMDGPVSLTANFKTSTIFPPILSGFPNAMTLEDKALIFSYVELRDYVVDMNDPIDNLEFSLNDGSHFSVTLDKENDLLSLMPEPDWSGTEEVVLSAKDPWGLADSDSFDVKVIDVFDLPKPFGLCSPEDGAVYSSQRENISFIWNTSVNVDTDDEITYQLYISADSIFSNGHEVRITTQDTCYQFNTDMLQGEIYWKVKAKDTQALSVWSQETWSMSVQTGIATMQSTPEQFVLHQNYPNPFNNGTLISYQIPQSQEVSIRIYNSRGQLIFNQLPQFHDPGYHSFQWHGRDAEGKDLPSGVYVIQVSAEGVCSKRKMILLR